MMSVPARSREGDDESPQIASLAVNPLVCSDHETISGPFKHLPLINFFRQRINRIVGGLAVIVKYPHVQSLTPFFVSLAGGDCQEQGNVRGSGMRPSMHSLGSR